ncbi:MAG: general secretion pathway protein GspK [Deltaproteobacteria bacterium]|nr:general secretion pathway protein GspK [Deltaproteobacteria bacterium]
MSVSQKKFIRIGGNDDGIALISVLWVLVLLTVIVSEFAYSMRTEVNITRSFKEATQAHYIAHSGVMRAVVEMIRNTARTKSPEDADEVQDGSIWRVNAPITPQRFGAGEFSVHIDNAAGLIDLNTASETVLRLMVNTLDISDREKTVIVDSILDWRDSDDFHRLHGAENNYYQSLPNPYACKNAAFDSVAELLLVRGMNPELFYKNLKSIVTIIPETKARVSAIGRSTRRAARTVSGQININAAPRRLLEALPQITPQQVQTLIDYRTSGDFISIAEIRDLIGAQTFSAISPYITLSFSPYYTIRAEGRVSGSSVKQIIQAMVKIDGELPGAYQIVDWQDQYY